MILSNLIFLGSQSPSAEPVGLAQSNIFNTENGQFDALFNLFAQHSEFLSLPHNGTIQPLIVPTSIVPKFKPFSMPNLDLDGDDVSWASETEGVPPGAIISGLGVVQQMPIPASGSNNNAVGDQFSLPSIALPPSIAPLVQNVPLPTSNQPTDIPVPESPQVESPEPTVQQGASVSVSSFADDSSSFQPSRSIQLEELSHMIRMSLPVELHVMRELNVASVEIGVIDNPEVNSVSLDSNNAQSSDLPILIETRSTESTIDVILKKVFADFAPREVGTSAIRPEEVTVRVSDNQSSQVLNARQEATPVSQQIQAESPKPLPSIPVPSSSLNEGLFRENFIQPSEARTGGISDPLSLVSQPLSNKAVAMPDMGGTEALKTFVLHNNIQQTVLSQSVVPEIAIPQSVVSQNVVSQNVAPEAIVPQDVLRDLQNSAIGKTNAQSLLTRMPMERSVMDMSLDLKVDAKIESVGSEKTASPNAEATPTITQSIKPSITPNRNTISMPAVQTELPPEILVDSRTEIDSSRNVDIASSQIKNDNPSQPILPPVNKSSPVVESNLQNVVVAQTNVATENPLPSESIIRENIPARNPVFFANPVPESGEGKLPATEIQSVTNQTEQPQRGGGDVTVAWNEFLNPESIREENVSATLPGRANATDGRPLAFNNAPVVETPSAPIATEPEQITRAVSADQNVSGAKEIETPHSPIPNRTLNSELQADQSQSNRVSARINANSVSPSTENANAGLGNETSQFSGKKEFSAQTEISTRLNSTEAVRGDSAFELVENRVAESNRVEQTVSTNEPSTQKAASFNQRVVTQITENADFPALKEKPFGDATIKLSPPGLGKLTIRILSDEQNAVAKAIITTQSVEVRDAIIANQSVLRTAFAERGIECSSFSVVVDDNASNHTRSNDFDDRSERLSSKSNDSDNPDNKDDPDKSLVQHWPQDPGNPNGRLSIVV